MTPAEFKKAVKHGLVDRDMSQTELIRLVREKTGMFLDVSYLNKIYRGEKNSPKIKQAIREILDLPEA